MSLQQFKIYIYISFPAFGEKPYSNSKRNRVNLEKDDSNYRRVVSFTAILANIDNHNDGQRRKKCNEQNIIFSRTDSNYGCEGFVTKS